MARAASSSLVDPFCVVVVGHGDHRAAVADGVCGQRSRRVGASPTVRTGRRAARRTARPRRRRWPPPAGAGDAVAASICASSAAVGSPVGRHEQAELAAHQAKNDCSTASKPSACPCVIWLNVSAGSMTLSSTMARTWVGNIDGVGQPEQRAVGLPHVGETGVAERAGGAGPCPAPRRPSRRREGRWRSPSRRRPRTA